MHLYFDLTALVDIIPATKLTEAATRSVLYK